VTAKNLRHAEIANRENYAADKNYSVSFVLRFEKFKYIPRIIASFKKRSVNI